MRTRSKRFGAARLAATTAAVSLSWMLFGMILIARMSLIT
jgi:hypothetical protein